MSVFDDPVWRKAALAGAQRGRYSRWQLQAIEALVAQADRDAEERREQERQRLTQTEADVQELQGRDPAALGSLGGRPHGD